MSYESGYNIVACFGGIPFSLDKCYKYIQLFSHVLLLCTLIPLHRSCFKWNEHQCWMSAYDWRCLITTRLDICFVCLFRFVIKNARPHEVISGFHSSSKKPHGSTSQQYITRLKKIQNAPFPKWTHLGQHIHCKQGCVQSGYTQMIIQDLLNVPDATKAWSLYQKTSTELCFTRLLFCLPTKSRFQHSISM